MTPVLAKIIEKVHIPRNVEYPETGMHIAADGGSSDDADTGSVNNVYG